MSYRVCVTPIPDRALWLDDCYPWWRNYINTEILPRKATMNDMMWEKVRTDVYAEYDIIPPEDPYSHYTFFKSQAHYTWFILRWS